MSANQCLWVVRYRYIAPDDYMTPMMYLPIQETHIEAETAQAAWESLVTGQYAGNRENYRKEEIYEHPWMKPNARTQRRIPAANDEDSRRAPARSAHRLDGRER